MYWGDVVTTLFLSTSSVLRSFIAKMGFRYILDFNSERGTLWVEVILSNKLLLKCHSNCPQLSI